MTGPFLLSKGHQQSSDKVFRRSSGISRSTEETILPTCRELGIGITAYGVLACGLISAHWQGAKESGSLSARAPRFQERNVERRLVFVETLRRIADTKSTSVAQLAIA
ncbi:aldo/keto reductase [Gluconobacter albidus]|uniref:aldo/keto reductase n=1 Tax=Gluconobacter albidus TaxID=318683 RepID=UPI002F918ADD